MDAPECLDLTEEVTELFRRKLLEFAAFAQAHWGYSDAEARDQGLSRDWQAGYQAALASLPDAIAHWTQEEVL